MWGPGFTDVDNAKSFAEANRETLRYVPGLGWHEWGGKVWRLLYGVPLDALIAWTDTLKPETPEDLNLGSFTEYDKRERWWLRARSEPALRKVIALAQDYPPMRASAEDFDADPMLLNCQDGVLNLDTLELVPHAPEYMLTKITGAKYNGPRGCPKWKEHVVDAMKGDDEMVEFLHRALGYTISGSTEEQVLFIVHGPGGTGKSLTLNVVRRVLGDYAQTADRNLLIKSAANAIGHNLVQLKGARFVMANETGAGNEMDEVAVKQLTGCDAVTGRLLYKNNITFTPSAKVWLATNHKPGIKSQDTGIWRRIREIPFDNVVDAAYRERDYDQRVVAEESTGVLRWLVKGYQKWREGGLTEPAGVMHAIEEYRDEGDRYRLADFIAQMCHRSDHVRGSYADLYTAYAVWQRGQEDAGPALSKPAFVEKLAERGYRRHRWHHGQTRGFLGITTDRPQIAN